MARMRQIAGCLADIDRERRDGGGRVQRPKLSLRFSGTVRTLPNVGAPQ